MLEASPKPMEGGGGLEGRSNISSKDFPDLNNRLYNRLLFCEQWVYSDTDNNMYCWKLCLFAPCSEIPELGPGEGPLLFAIL